MNNNSAKSGKMPGSAMRIGAITAIVFGSIAMAITGIFSIVNIATGVFVNNETASMSNTGFNFHPGNFLYGFAIFCLIISLINVPNIIANTMLLKGKLNSSLIPGILAIVGLGVGVIGIIIGVVIIIGKFEDEVKNSQNENFIYRNFNAPKWGPNTNNENSSNSSASWKQATAANHEGNQETVVNAQAAPSENTSGELDAMKTKIDELEQKLKQKQETN